MAEKRLIDLSTLGIGERNPNAFNDPERAYGWNDLLKILEAAPTVDAVEVVRCRECHCYTPVDKRIGKCVFLIGEHQYVVPNGYCYLGERKENENV